MTALRYETAGVNVGGLSLIVFRGSRDSKRAYFHISGFCVTTLMGLSGEIIAFRRQFS